MRVKICGHFWNLRRVPFLGSKMADCDTVDTPNKEIRIEQGLRDEIELNATIHELNHCALSNIDEDTINTMSTDIARVLWRLGYRKLDSDQLKEFDKNNV